MREMRSATQYSKTTEAHYRHYIKPLWIMISKY